MTVQIRVSRILSCSINPKPITCRFKEFEIKITEEFASADGILNVKGTVNASQTVSEIVSVKDRRKLPLNDHSVKGISFHQEKKRKNIPCNRC